MMLLITGIVLIFSGAIGFIVFFLTIRQRAD
jgi:preprotein translocase subunit Sss1